MKSEIKGAPSFAYIDVELNPGETITAEADAMASMSAELDMKAVFNGGFFSGLLKSLLGNESLFVNEFTNNTSETLKLTLVQPTPGDIREIKLSNSSICMQPGAYLCSTPGVNLSAGWAGISSWIGREGLFKLVASGTGSVWCGAYGGLFEKKINGEYIVDSGHLVAYDPQIRLKVRLAGGIFSSFFGGEGLVTRVEGSGNIILQSRSMSGLRDWLNPKL